MSTNENLNNAIRNCNDEFYTLREDVDKIMSYIQKYYASKGIKDVMYIFPADSNNSEFVKYAIAHCLVYTNFVCIGKEAWIINGNPTKHYCIVTNPPFSKFKDYFENVVNKYVDNPFVTFTYIVPTLIATYKWFVPYNQSFTYYGNMIDGKFFRPDGSIAHVNTIVMSTIKSFNSPMLIPSEEEEPPIAIQNKEDNNLCKIRYFYWMLNHDKFKKGDKVYLSPNSISYSRWLKKLGWQLIDTQFRNVDGSWRTFLWEKIK